MPKNLRQFEDLLVLAERVLNGDNFEADLETFARFSEDMQHWLLDNFDDPMITSRAEKIPRIQFEKSRTSLWDMLPGGGGIGMLKSYRKKSEAREQVREAARLYASIHYLLRNYDEDLV